MKSESGLEESLTGQTVHGTAQGARKIAGGGTPGRQKKDATDSTEAEFPSVESVALFAA